MLDKETLQARLAAIRMVVLDVDGVLTDGKITYTSSGEEIKSFHVRDGYGMAMARRRGLKFAIVSGRYSEVTAVRAKELNVELVMQGIGDKSKAIQEVSERAQIPLQHIVFIGDDVIDLPAMELAGLSAAPADAHPEVIAKADYVTRLAGGQGAVRELIDMIEVANISVG